MANIDEWKWKLSMLLRSETDQEIISRDKRDRRDYEQVSFLAKRMGLYRYMSAICFFIYIFGHLWRILCYFTLHTDSCYNSQIYGKAVVASKVPLPNYRPDLDDKRPQREV